jgi:ubiquitin carboxyl-terminal hydrolase MINDY-1/2
MDLNPMFTDPIKFRPAGKGGELALFSRAGIQLVHGWLVDPNSSEHPAISKLEDYDSTVNLIVEADHLTSGKLVGPDFDQSGSGFTSPTAILSNDDRRKVEDGSCRLLRACPQWYC